MSTYTIVHLTFWEPQIVDCVRVYANVYLTVHLRQRSKYFEVERKRKVYSTHHKPRTYSGYPDCFYREKKQQIGLLSNQNKTTRQLSFWKERTWSVLPNVCWFKTTSLLANILIRTPRLCRNRGFAQITKMLLNKQIMVEVFNFSQLIHRVVVDSGVFMQHGWLPLKYIAKSYCKEVLLNLQQNPIDAWITDSDQGNNYVSGLEDKIMNGVYP